MSSLLTSPLVGKYDWFGPDEQKDLYDATEAPFILEYQGKYEEAIEAHKTAATKLETFIQKAKKKIWKLPIAMCEQQMKIHQDRKTYLDGLAAEGSFEGVVVPPTTQNADDALKVEDGEQRCLSLVCNT